MYLGIDVGGTKTLVATLTSDGEITDSRRFPSDPDYDKFLENLSANLKELDLTRVEHVCAGIPGLLDREAGLVLSLGNLPWGKRPVKADIEKMVGKPVIIENDSQLAGLSEGRLISSQYHNILFITVSTGIGGALVRNGRLAEALLDMEMGKMPLLFEGEYIHWEDFAGGRGVVNRFNKRADEITDPDAWRAIGKNIAYGLGAVCSVLQPDVVILGGSVGKHADKYHDTLLEFLDSQLHSVVRRPEAILPAQRPDEAVIYGCYELAKQVHYDRTNR